jgi:Ca2+-binding EF-hand superfamily protein
MTAAAPNLDARREVAHGLFSSFDLDGNGVVGLHELMQVVQSTRRVGDKKHLKRIRVLEAEIRQAIETHKKTGMGRLALKSGGLVTFAEGQGEPSLDPQAFVNFIVGLTRDDTQEEFENFVQLSQEAVEDAFDLTQGSSHRRDVWSVFQLLDINQDGFVDMSELEVLLDVETKSDKKAITKWRSVLSQRQLESRLLAPITHASEGATPEPADSNKDGELRLALGDFHKFITEFTENDDGRVASILRNVREAMQKEYNAYLDAKRVNAVLDAVLEDLIRERPDDVLDGIIRSCERMKRTGTTGRGGLQRVQSTVTIRDNTKQGRLSRRSSMARTSGNMNLEGTTNGADSPDPQPL